MKFTIAISLGLIFAYLAGEIGLAPIVGAFAAGLILDPVHFRYFKDPHIVKEVREVISDINGGTKERLEVAMEKHAHRHIEDLIEPLANFVVPIFFVFTGMQVKIATLFDPTIIVTALIITLIAFVGKLASGLVIKGRDKWIVGWGMAPRGEVGLIFAAIGQQLGVVNDEVFSIIVIMVVLTTLLTPLILTHLLKKDTGNIQEQPATA
jgi:Kef-type K+ transport system membrane component KefB